MSALEAVKSIEQHLVAFVESAKEKLEQDLPEVAKVATDAESNPVVQAVAMAAHLPGLPGSLAALGAFITALDQEIGAAKANAAAEALDAAAHASGEQPAQPA